MKYINKLSNYGYLYRESRLKSGELKGFHYACLRIVCKNEGLSQGELAKRMFVNKSTITRWLSYMEERGYISRKVDDNNKRVTRVYKTKKAEGILPEIIMVFDEWENCILSGFEDDEKRELISMLQRLIANAVENAEVGEEEEF